MDCGESGKSINAGVDVADNKRARIREVGRVLYGVVSSRYRGEPFSLSHLVTRKCNCRCETCLWSDDESSDELSAEEIGRVYAEARDLGVIANALWGGEPLMREDLPEIVRSSKSNGFVTTVITNGYYLKERLEGLSDWVDCFIVSIDEVGERHDRMRGREGIFERAVEGIERAKRYRHIKVMINSVFSKLNRDSVEELVYLAESLGVSIYLCPIETGAAGSHGFEASKRHLGLSDEELDDFCKRVIGLKRKGYKINNSLTYLKTFIGGKKKYKCHAQKAAVTLDANGSVKNCIAVEPFGNVRQTSLKGILKSESVRQARRDSEKCNVCNNPDVIDCSYFWELRPESVWSFVKVCVG
ncbi:MAG: radical SAM protein [Planctomycetota bacterium]|jgi:MoaA/NifB/PqqE/SkfB family radical SAM enzyme